MEGRTDLPRTGINPKRGTVTLNGVTAVNVSCPEVTSASLIFTGLQAASGTIGVVVVSGRTPGVGFSLVSVLLNTSVCAWMVVEP